MSLTLDDVRRLERAGATGFFRREADGALRLCNRDGQCVFLDHGRCSHYADRPEGCVLYPLVWDDRDHAAVLDDFCPYAHEFRFSTGDREWLERSIATEEEEIAARRGQRPTPQRR